MLLSHLRLSLPANLFPSGLRIKVQDVSIFSHMHATYPAHLIVLDILFNYALRNTRIECKRMKSLCLRRTREMPTEFWWANMKERDHLEDIPVHGTIILKWIWNKWSWAAFFRVEIQTSGELLWTRWWTVGNMSTRWETIRFTKRALLLGVIPLWKMSRLY
jgi:hypothetical protein